MRLEGRCVCELAEQTTRKRHPSHLLIDPKLPQDLLEDPLELLLTNVTHDVGEVQRERPRLLLTRVDETSLKSQGRPHGAQSHRMPSRGDGREVKIGIGLNYRRRVRVRHSTGQITQSLREKAQKGATRGREGDEKGEGVLREV